MMHRVMIIVCIVLLLPHVAWAQISLIRDAEIEETLRLYADPLLQVAGLDPTAVDVLIINNNQLNAFVTGGQNIFIHTGLIQRMPTPDALKGVIAHEIGHIAGGHLARTRLYAQDLTTVGIISTILGGAAAAGSGAAGTAVLAGSQSVLQRLFLNYTRTHERSADQAAVFYMEGIQRSPAGLKQALEVILRQENISVGKQDPYMRSHPITRDRIEFLSAAIAASPYQNASEDAQLVTRHQRMIGKLDGFLMKPQEVMNKYPDTDQSLQARIARVVAKSQSGQFAAAIKELDALLKAQPNDAYFLELKGQLHLERGKIKEAIQFYQQAVKQRSDQPLLRLGLAQSLLATQDQANWRRAATELRRVTQQSPRHSFAWRQLGVALGKLGEKGEAALALAEQANIEGRDDLRRTQAQRASDLLTYGSPSWLRAQDLLLKPEANKS